MAAFTFPITQAIQDIARRLNALYVPLHAPLTRFPAPPPPGQPIRYLFPTSALASDLYLPGDGLPTLVCMTSNSVSTFWAIVGEAFEMEDMRPPRGAALRLQGRECGWGTGEVVLQYCYVPPGFDIALVEAYGMPRYETKRERRSGEGVSLALVRDAVCMNLAGADGHNFPWDEKKRAAFRAVFLKLRRWMVVEGLLGEEAGYMGTEGLLWSLYYSMVPEPAVHDKEFEEDAEEDRLMHNFFA